MTEFDVRSQHPNYYSKEDIKVFYGRNNEYIVSEEGDYYLMLQDEDGDRVRIFNTDIDILILALKKMKEHI